MLFLCRQSIVSSAMAALLLGCATPPPPPLYLWENFTRQQYEALQHPDANPEEQIRILQAHIEKARATDAALPPGLRAHLGMLYLSGGNAQQARELWQAEKAAFPESASYMDQLLKRLNDRARVDTPT